MNNKIDLSFILINAISFDDEDGAFCHVLDRDTAFAIYSLLLPLACQQR